MHPRTKADFDTLYSELGAWREHETARIKSSGQSPAEQQHELAQLLAKEVKLLQTIDRLKISAARTNAADATRARLEKMAGPKEWLAIRSGSAGQGAALTGVATAPQV